jgi:hypothetical protein
MSPKLVVILTVAVPVRAGGGDIKGAADTEAEEAGVAVGDWVGVDEGAAAIGQPFAPGDIVGPRV